jgi:hypothetical protein
VLGCNSIIRQSSGTFSEAPEPICLPGKLQLLEPYGIFARHRLSLMIPTRTQAKRGKARELSSHKSRIAH